MIDQILQFINKSAASGNRSASIFLLVSGSCHPVKLAFSDLMQNSRFDYQVKKQCIVTQVCIEAKVLLLR